MLIVSAFLKKEYNINAAIFDEIINIRMNDIASIDPMQLTVMFEICFATSFSLCIFLASIISAKWSESRYCDELPSVTIITSTTHPFFTSFAIRKTFLI